MIFWIQVTLALVWVFVVGICALIFSPILFPLKWFNTFLIYYVSWGVLKLFGIQLEIFGKENIPQKDTFSVVMMRHQSIFDYVIYGMVAPKNLVIIGKKEILWIPLVGWVWALGGNLSIDRRNAKEAIQKFKVIAKKMVQRRLMVAIFPEGTRNKTGEGLLPFKKGGFYLAIDAQAPVLPAVCTQLKRVFDFPGRKIRGGKVRVAFLPMISTQGLRHEDVESLSATVWSNMAESLERLESQMEFTQKKHEIKPVS